MQWPNLLPKWIAEREGGRNGPGGTWFFLKHLLVVGGVLMVMVILAAPDHDEPFCSCRCREAVREEAATRLQQALRAWEREPAEAAERSSDEAWQMRQMEAERQERYRMLERAERERADRVVRGAAVHAGQEAAEEADEVAEPTGEVDR